jgi:hypothetical protein
MLLTLTNLALIQLKSFCGDGVVYTVDRSGRTCTCHHFSAEGHCKHLDEFGLYKRREFIARIHPTFSQALSGLVKSIRMRRVEDATYWLMYLDRIQASETLGKKAARFRVARRILIGSAEDGHSISVMEHVTSNFKFLCKLDTPLVYLAMEIFRICKLPNWWNPITGGHDYIHNSLVGYRQQVLYQKVNDQDGARKLLRKAIDEADSATAIGAVSLMGAVGLGSTGQAQCLMAIAQEMNHEKAIRLLGIHLGARSALSGDNNFTSQAAWLLAGGQSPVADQIEPVLEGEAHELLDKANERWKHPKPIPHYYCDGIHCGGKDRRYAGILQDMYAVCCCFSHYGNIEPENLWLPEFYPTDGLAIEPSLQSIA